MFNQNYQSFPEPPKNAQPTTPNLSWSKVLFLVHLAIFLFIALMVMAYLYHSYRQGIAPSRYGFRGGDSFSWGYYGMQQAAPSFGPILILLFGWGMGLILHFLGVFVFANRLFPGLSALSQGTFYQPEQPPVMQQPETYNFDNAHHFPYAWPLPPEPGPTQIEPYSKKDSIK